MIDFLYVVLAGVYDIGNTFLDFITFDTGYHIAFFSAVAAGIGGLLGLGSQKSANKANLQATRETNEMNYKMFKEANAFNEYMSDKAWDRETAYNDPAAQLERYKNAGINGQVAMSGSLGSAGNTPADYAAASSAAPPMFQAPTVQPLNMTPFAEAAAAVAQIAQAKKAGAETKTIESMVDEQLRGITLENDTKEFKLALDKVYAIGERNQGLRNLTAEYAKLCAEKVAAYAQGRYFDESALEKVELSLLHKAEQKLKTQEYTQMVELLPLVKRHQEALIKTENSKQAANYAAAEESSAAAENQRAQAAYTGSLQETEDALRDLKVTQAESDAAYGEVKNMLSTLDLSADLQKKLLDTYFSGGLNAVVGRLFKSMKNEIEITQANKEVNRLIEKIKNRRYRFQDK